MTVRSVGEAASDLLFAFPGQPRVGCLFTTTGRGNLSLEAVTTHEERDRARKARLRLLADCGSTGWSEVRQVHGDAVLVDPAPGDPEKVPALEADGQCTSRPGLALVIKTADCQPLLLAHKSGNHVAALHVGWRGNAADFPRTGAQAFCRAYGLRPEDVLAVRGPSLGPQAARFVNFHREWPRRFAPWFNGQSRTMDLWSLTRRQLEQAGLLPEHIFSLDLCTHGRPDLLFSHRRGHTGRQMGVIWIKPAA